MGRVAGHLDRCVDDLLSLGELSQEDVGLRVIPHHTRAVRSNRQRERERERERETYESELAAELHDGLGRDVVGLQDLDRPTRTVVSIERDPLIRARPRRHRRGRVLLELLLGDGILLEREIALGERLLDHSHEQVRRVIGLRYNPSIRGTLWSGLVWSRRTSLRMYASASW